jgi:hypothetical protein
VFARGIVSVRSNQSVWLDDAAYATLVGELGPKSILLLLIGLVAGVVVRFVVRLLRRLVSRATASDPVGEHA